MTSALGSPQGQAVHFQAQLTDESIVVESYYQTGSTDGFGKYWKFPISAPKGVPAFLPGAKKFSPFGLRELTLFATFQDVRPNHKVGSVSNRTFVGNVTHPSGAPDNHLLTVWAPPIEGQDQNHPQYDAGIYLLKSGIPINHPSKMLVIKNSPKYQELWPRPVVPYSRIYGVDEPELLTHSNDGKKSPHLPEGTPFGLVGSSSLYKRESYPGGIVPDQTVTAQSTKADNRRFMWREQNDGNNWSRQGADSGLYGNSEIWGIRIVATEPVSDVVFRRDRHFSLASNAEERLRILGEFPVRKFRPDGTQPDDPDGNPDTSFLAKIPADVAWTLQTLDNRGMVLNMAQTWHQVRPGEMRVDCGGCHAHSQRPLDFELTAAADPAFKPWNLTENIPLFTTAGADESGKQWDKKKETGVRFGGTIEDVEFFRDVKPIFDRSCVACHSTSFEEPAGDLALDDYRPFESDRAWTTWNGTALRIPKNLPRTYMRLAQYSPAFQSRKNMLIWKIFGRRLDGFENGDIDSPELDYENLQHIRDWGHHSKRKERDRDFEGDMMPPPDAVEGTCRGPGGKLVKVPPLTEEEKLTLVRWIDLGCPINIDDPDSEQSDQNFANDRGLSLGWFLDESRPTLTLTSPAPGKNPRPLSRILIGMSDYGTDLDLKTLSVKADFAIDGTAPGQDSADKFRKLPDGRWEFKLGDPATSLRRGQIEVTVKDRQGNQARVVRTFSIGQ